MTLQTDGRTDRGYNNIPTFSKSAGININLLSAEFAHSMLSVNKSIV